MRQVPNEIFFDWVSSELSEGKDVRIRMKGWSMRPLLRPGKDEVVLGTLKDGEPSRLDVVLFHYKGQTIFHRVLRIDGNEYTIQGDGNFTGQEKCGREDIVGKLREVVRPSGAVIPVTTLRWRAYSRLWLIVRPLVGCLFRIRSFLSVLKHKKPWKNTIT